MLGPLREAGRDGVTIQPGEDAAEGVVRGNTSGQTEEGLEPFLPGLAILGDLREVVGSAQYGEERDGEDIDQLVVLGTLDPGVGNRGQLF